MLGMQLLRSLLTYFRPLLGERLGWTTIYVGLFALLIFLSALLAGPLNRFFGGDLLILITGFVVGSSRLAAQFWTADPIGDLIYAIAGVCAFNIFLPTAVGITMNAGSQRSASLALVILTGIAFDLVLNGVFITYDLIWQTGIWPELIVLILIVVQWVSLFLLLRQEKGMVVADVRFAQAFTWSLIGPFLFLQLLIFTNIAWTTTTTSWSFPAAFFWLLLAHGIGIAMWAFLEKIARILLAGAWIIVLVSQALSLMGSAEVWVTAVYLLCGQVAIAGNLVTVLGYLGVNASRSGLRNVTLASGAGMLILVILLFTYYAAYDILLPFSNQVLPLTALLLILVIGLVALLHWWRNPIKIHAYDLRFLSAVVLIALLIPLILGLINDPTTSPNGSGEVLRVTTYNIHYGTNPDGQLDLEAVAKTIEAEHADVVSLQEVSRGWVINGSVDMLTWLAQRLDMTPVFGPTSDLQWGNAILSKLPVIKYAHYPLPTEELLLKRGYIHARLKSPDGTVFNLINTHYHNPAAGGDVRVLQSQSLLDFSEGMSNLIITGDLNAEHGMPEVDMFVNSGLGDVLDLTTTEPGYTNPVPNPSRRIDYIFVTRDWLANSAVVPYSESSDHLPIAVTLTSNN